MKKVTIIQLCPVWLFPFSLQARTATPPRGNGTAPVPYRIVSLDNHYWVSKYGGMWDKYFIRTNDNASSTAARNSNPGFTLIGNATTPFTGNYDGLDSVMDSIALSRNTINNIGLFHKIVGGVKKNLEIDNVNITGNNYLAIFAGVVQGDSTLIELCYTISNRANENNDFIRNSHFTGIVTCTGNNVTLIRRFILHGRTMTIEYIKIDSKVCAGISLAGYKDFFSRHLTINNSYHSSYGSVRYESKAIGYIVSRSSIISDCYNRNNLALFAVKVGVGFGGTDFSLDGYSNLQFNNSKDHSLFTVIHHGNHLAVILFSKVTKTGGFSTYDYTASTDQASGTKTRKDLGNGVYGMISADDNAIGNINTGDKTIWEMQPSKQDHKSADFNLDAQVNIPTKMTNGYRTNERGNRCRNSAQWFSEYPASLFALYLFIVYVNQ